MAKILLNPKEGAPIQDIQVESKRYFAEAPWEVDTIKKFEDDTTADIIQEIYGFLVELSLDQAKSYVENQKKSTFKCPICEDWVTTTQLALDKHLEKHAKEDAVVKELGVEEIKSEKKSKKDKDVQEKINEQAKSEGLIGEGLVDETRPVKARF